MPENLTLPPDLIKFLGSEKRDFTIKTNRAQPLKKSALTILIGISWTAIPTLIALHFLIPIFQSQEVHFANNIVAGPNHLDPIIVPTVLLTGLALIGLNILISGIYLIFKKTLQLNGQIIGYSHQKNLSTMSSIFQESPTL